MEGFTTRPPTQEDAQAICDLIAAFDAAHSEAPVATNVPQDIQEGWRRLNPETDAWVFCAPDGRIAAYGEVADHGFGQLWADCYVHPSFAGRGLGTALVYLTETRARELVANAPENARVVLGNGVLLSDASARALMERSGYHLTRVHWRMGIDLGAEPPTPEWPEGIALRAFVPGQDERAVFDVVEEAFSDHWGHVPHRFDEWLHHIDRSDFDPSLWLLAVEDDQLVGVALCRRRPDTGWVGSLGVRRRWRGRGLGTALLRHSFRVFWDSGEQRVGLGVDAQNLTGAVRIYTRAGMHVVEQAALYEKELRPGVDLGTRELAL